MLKVFDIFVIVSLLAILYAFYNILYSHENNTEDFLIYDTAKNRDFIFLGSNSNTNNYF